jgi:superfamily II DNA or RNA helicase
MPKAILSNKIYLDTTPELTKELVKALTYKIKKPPRPGLTHFSMYDIVKTYKIIGPKVIAIPSGRLDLIPTDYEIIDRRSVNEMPFPYPKSELRSEQLEVYNQVDGMCFINAMVGWGKTYTALHIARKLEQKTLIVCHTTVLRDQWIEEATNLFGMKIGVIGSGEFDIDHAIVVGNIQTLSKRLPDIAKEFGTVILDEAHHCSATTFTIFMDGMYAKHKIGLSGTMTRKDGRQVVFKDFFGSKLFQPAQSNTMTPSVKIVQTGITLAPGEAWANKINTLLYDESYQGFIAKVAQTQMAQGHKVLIVADRVEFLNKMGELIGEKCVCITGETDTEVRKDIKRQVEEGEKDCVAGSRQIISEGWSVNPLSCVILAGPISAPAGADGLLEQIIGRIQRMWPGKVQPLVIDMQFAGFADKKQNKERIAFYTRKGWDMVGIQ